MVKKLIALLLVLLLPAIVLAESQVIDNANLFTAADVSAMNSIIARIEKAPEKGEETVAKARQFFTFDGEAERVLNLAITLNK